MNTTAEACQTNTVQPSLLGVLAHTLRPPLTAARQAFQQGLGDVAHCEAALAMFSDAGSEFLAFVVRTPDGDVRTINELANTRDKQSLTWLTERGAAYRTSLLAGIAT